MSKLLNKSAVRKAIMSRAGSTGRGEVLTRVDASIYAHLAALIGREINTLVHQHPSGFRTLKL